MITLLLMILLIVGLFKMTGVLFHIAGHILGGIFGIIGWLILAGLAVTVFGAAIFVLPVIMIVGIIALIAAMAS